MHRLLTTICIATSCCLFAGADWLQFRGPGGTSVASGSKLPAAIGAEENLAWKVALPERGVSSPIVVDGRVIVTAAGGVKHDRLHVLCYDADSGEQLWQRQFWATGRTYTHPSSSVAAPTPASDGKRIFAFYSSNDLICLDLDGNLLWYRGLAFDYPKAGNDIGMSSSPVVSGETVLVQIENQGDSFAAALNSASGETRWRIQRDQQANWASPTVLPADGERKELFILQSHGGVAAHDPLSGEQIWSYETECSGIPSPVATAKRVFLPSNGTTALKFTGNSAAPQFDWDAGQLRPGSATAVVDGDRIYTLNGGVVSCGDANTGESLWKLRIEGKHWATPVIAGDLMYFINQDGDAKVVRLGEKGEIVGRGKLGENVQGSPAVAGSALFVRSDNYLWKFAAE